MLVIDGLDCVAMDREPNLESKVITVVMGQWGLVYATERNTPVLVALSPGLSVEQRRSLVRGFLLDRWAWKAMLRFGSW